MITSIFPASKFAQLVPAIVVGASLVGASGADAQAPAAAQASSRIAVIDIKYILENHVRFKASMDQLKTRYETAGKRLNEERNKIVGMQKRLLELNAGTPDYNQLDEEISRAKADWGVEADKHKKEIRNSESQILWNVYYEIKTETKRYCEQNGIGLVIQFNGDPIDSKQPQDVVKGISRPIVYNAQNLDITPWILKALNSGAATAIRPAPPRPANQNLPLQR